MTLDFFFLLSPVQRSVSLNILHALGGQQDRQGNRKCRETLVYAASPVASCLRGSIVHPTLSLSLQSKFSLAIDHLCLG